MPSRLRIVVGAALLVTAGILVQLRKSVPVAASSAASASLTIMGKVADTSDPAELKVFEEYTSKTGVQVHFPTSLQTVNERIDLFLSLFRKHSAEPDLVDMDVIWPATLASDLIDLKPFFENELKDFAPELMDAFTVEGRLVAMPTFVDIGILYYREDLLHKYGFHRPPRSWEELEFMAFRIQEGERRSGNTDFWGYVWQGGAYESLTCNALEWQASSGGGEILGPGSKIRIRNAQFLHALRRATGWIGRISPPGQSAFGEDDSYNFYLSGKAAFMRNWSGSYTTVLHGPNHIHKFTATAPLPAGDGGPRGSLGGSGTGISKYSPHPEQALQLLRMIVSSQTQRHRAQVGGLIPTRISLRTQEDLMAHTPLHGRVASEVVENLVSRPALLAGNTYSQVSRAYYTAVHSVLAREQTPETAIAQLETELVKITGFQVER